MANADSFQWYNDHFGSYRLLDGDVEVGRVWCPKGRIRAAWSAGNVSHGVPESGIHEASSIDDAKTACKVWVILKMRVAGA